MAAAGFGMVGITHIGARRDQIESQIGYRTPLAAGPSHTGGTAEQQDSRGDAEEFENASRLNVASCARAAEHFAALICASRKDHSALRDPMETSASPHLRVRIILHRRGGCMVCELDLIAL